MEAPDTFRPDDVVEADRLLAVYLRDHFAGAAAGLALVRRCRANNTGTDLDVLLATIEREIDEDRASLRAMMKRLGVDPDPLKSALAAAAELVGRLKTNGRLFRYSPSSRVVELEGLAAGIVTKRSLWTALRAVAAARPELDAAELEQLTDRATSQYERVMEAHDRAARHAFAIGQDTPPRFGAHV